MAVWYAEPVPISSTVSSPRSASISVMRATMYGCEMVWPRTSGSGVSSYAPARHASGTNSWRGTLRMRVEHARALDVAGDDLCIDHVLACCVPIRRATWPLGDRAVAGRDEDRRGKCGEPRVPG